MKKIICIITAALALACCTKEVANFDSQSIDDPSNEVITEGTKTVTFTAKLEVPEAPAHISRGTVATTGAFTWSDTDEIAVWTSSQKRTATATNISGSTADFTFTLEGSETISTGAIVVYPASLLTAAGVVTYPTAYSAAEAAKSNLALAAEVGGSTLSFKYLGAVIEATITDVPSIADAIEVTSTAVLTGAHTISFSEGVPSMATSSTAKTVTITPAAGSNTIVLPLPTAANDADETNDQSITYTVKFSSDELFTKTASKDIDRGEYFKMSDLTINPTVRFVGSLTSWDTPANYADAILTGASSSRSVTMTANGSENYYYYLVEYPGNGSAVSYEMRPSSDQSTAALSASETMYKNDSNYSSKVNAYGRYTFTFDYTTATNAVTLASSSDIAIYLVGSFQSPTSWALNEDTPLTMVNDHEGYKVMDVSASSSFKAYTNPFWGSAFPAADVTLDEANYYIMIANANACTLQGVYANGTSSEAASMVIKGTFNSWGDGLSMTQIDSSPFWYVDVNWGSETQFKFFKDGDTWMANGSGSFVSSGVSQTWSGDGNIIVPAGKYRIIGSEYQNVYGSFAILALD